MVIGVNRENGDDTVRAANAQALRDHGAHMVVNDLSELLPG